MEKSKDIKETHKDFRSKRGAFSRKSYDGRDGSRNRRVNWNMICSHYELRKFPR